MTFLTIFKTLFGLNPDAFTFYGGGGGGGSSRQTTSQELDPTVRPFVKYGLEEAQQLYKTPGPSYYPYQTFVGPSAQTQQAFQAAQTRALQGSPLVPQAQQTVSGLQQAVNPALSGFQQLQQSGISTGYNPALASYQALQGGGTDLGLPGTQQTAGGAYLGSNPFFNAALAGAGQAATRQYLDAISQGRSGASLAGRYGSGAATELESRSQQNLANALTQRAGELAYQQYGMERGLQESALGRLSDISGQNFQQRLAAAQGLGGLAESQLGRQMTAQQQTLQNRLAATQGLGSLAEQQAQRQMAAAQAAPQLAAADYFDIAQLQQIGETAEDYQQRALDADIARYEYGANLPYTKLQSFLSAAYGAPMGQVTSTSSSGGGK